MDSGNSSSIQSSSGGVLGGCNGGDQEEYNSRADQSISALFNTNNTNTNTSSTQLDPLIANYFTNSNPIWSSSKPQFTNPPQEHQQQQQQIPSPNTNMNTKNPKKRSRASRRAPTTVLTTDTSNFRAMVQEFTGNPSTPFTGSLNLNPFHKSTQRFDLFGSSSSSSSSFPLKPFAHKLVPPSSSHYLSSSIHQQNHIFNINNQNLTNPFFNTQSLTNPLSDQGVLLQKSKPLFDVERFGHVEGLHNIVDSSSRQENLDHRKNSEEGDVLMRSINGGYNRERNDDSGPSSSSALAPESNLTSTVRNEGMVELSWICSSD